MIDSCMAGAAQTGGNFVHCIASDERLFLLTSASRCKGKNGDKIGNGVGARDACPH